jgi:hypothetical protein
METKYCPGCKTEKSVAEFTKSSVQSGGYQSECKECMRGHQKNWLQRHPEKVAEYRAASNRRMKRKYALDAEHRKKKIKASADWRKKVGPNVVARLNRRVRLAREYNITIEEADALLVECGGVCEICHNPSKTKLGIDHCHETEGIRGILCRRCNVALAALGDSMEGLMRAVEYLRRFEVKRQAEREYIKEIFGAD